MSDREEAQRSADVWVYDGCAIDQVIPEFNPDLNMLAGMYPDAIYFYAELVIAS